MKLAIEIFFVFIGWLLILNGLWFLISKENEFPPLAFQGLLVALSLMATGASLQFIVALASLMRGGK